MSFITVSFWFGWRKSLLQGQITFGLIRNEDAKNRILLYNNRCIILTKKIANRMRYRLCNQNIRSRHSARISRSSSRPPPLSRRGRQHECANRERRSAVSRTKRQRRVSSRNDHRSGRPAQSEAQYRIGRRNADDHQ